MPTWWRWICAVSLVEMVRNRCFRSFIFSSLVVSIVIIFQLFVFDDTTSDTERFWRESDGVITNLGDEREWNRRAIESFSFICPNCTFTDHFNINRTTDNDTVHAHETFYQYLRQYLRQLNNAHTIRNLDKFDLQANNDGSLLIVIQVRSFY